MQVLSKKHTIRGVQLDVKRAVTKEENQKNVSDEMLRKIFLAQINSKLNECRCNAKLLVDLVNHFSKFDKVESITIKRDGGYGFLLFKSRRGPINVFEAGEIHQIKGFKIECRKVLARDSIKQQTVPVPPNSKSKPATAVSASTPQGHPVSAEKRMVEEINRLLTINEDYDQLKSSKSSVLDTTTATGGGGKSTSKLKCSSQRFDFEESQDGIDFEDWRRTSNVGRDSSFIDPALEAPVNELTPSQMEEKHHMEQRTKHVWSKPSNQPPYPQFPMRPPTNSAGAQHYQQMMMPNNYIPQHAESSLAPWQISPDESQEIGYQPSSNDASTIQPAPVTSVPPSNKPKENRILKHLESDDSEFLLWTLDSGNGFKGSKLASKMSSNEQHPR